LVGITASYGIQWEFLSEKHKDLEKYLDEIFEEYAGAPGPEFYWAYVVVGVFGAGKTQFLYHIFKKSLQKGFLPLYFIAEDLFGEIFKVGEEDRTPGTLAELALEKVKKARDAIAKADKEALEEILNPKHRDDLKEMIEELLDAFASKDISKVKTVVLVDELEQQYKPLQDWVRSGERSPLRDWLERKDSLKFLALAPAGIYEMGGADQSRCGRLVIPPVDVAYIRQTFFPKKPGRANACWWLSRGKPRHAFKAAKKLKDVDVSSMDASEIYLFIRDELDHIGQEPSRVPPAIFEGLKANKYHYLLDLTPIDGERGRRYCISVGKLDIASFADGLIDAFKLKREDSLLISYYFKMVIKALSDEENFVYINPNDLPDLLALTLDLLLEYEHGSPGIKDRLGSLMGLYEEFEDPALHFTLHHLWEMREISREFPLSMREMRRTFPFPVMNPMVKDYVPKDMKERWEGNFLPIWMWEEGNITVLFFASWRDFENYSQTDEFQDLTLPQNRGALCILPEGELKELRVPFLQWLERNGKLKVTSAPPLLTDFLLSIAGEIEEMIPGRLEETLSILKRSKEDPILSRKVRIYSESLNELIKASLPRTLSFCERTPPDADTVWGKNQIGWRGIVVLGIALAFVDLNLEEKNLLAQLRELFKGGRGGEGRGALHFTLGRRGHVSIATDILPHYERGEPKDSAPILRLKRYLRGERELTDLARLVPLQSFLKLESEEDINRLLEAFWRAVRRDFDYEGLDELILWIERDVVPTIKEAIDLERRSIESFGLEGIDFEDAEDVVRVKDSFERLLQGAKKAMEDKGSGAPLVKALYKIFVLESKENMKDLRILQTQLGETKDALDKLVNVCNDLKSNFWEYENAAQFAGLKEEDIKQLISKETALKGKLTFQKLREEVDESIGRIERISIGLRKLDEKIKELDEIFVRINEG